MFCESPVARVVGGNCHNCARAITCQHIVAHIDRNTLTCEGVDCIGASEHTANTLGLGDALPLGTLLGCLQVCLNLTLGIGYRKLFYPLVLGCDNHKCYAKNGVGAGGENFEFLVASLNVEKDLSTRALANPVALNLFERLAPFELVQTLQQAGCIGGNSQQPLLHSALNNGEATTHRKTVLNLVVGKHGAQLGTPVYHCVGTECEAVVLEHLLLFLLVVGVPLLGGEAELLGASSVQAFGTTLRKASNEVLDFLCLAESVVVVVGEHFEECPLGPLIILGLAGAYLARPIVRETNLVELRAIACYILLGGHCGVLTSLNCVLLGGQTKGIVTHWVQDIKAARAFVARVDVRSDVAQRVTDVKSRTRGVGEHIENIKFGFRGVYLNLVGFLLLPPVLPLGFEFFEVVFHCEVY